MRYLQPINSIGWCGFDRFLENICEAKDLRMIRTSPLKWMKSYWFEKRENIFGAQQDFCYVSTCNSTNVGTFGELKEERKMHHGGSYCYIHSHLQVKLIIQNLGFFYFQSLMNESNILNAWEYLRLSMNSVGCFSIIFFLLVKCIYFFDFYVFQHKKVPTVKYIEREGNQTKIVFKI